MIRKILSLCCLLSGASLFAQMTKPIASAKYNCTYEYSVSTSKGKEVASTVLQFNDKEARFMDYSAFELDSVGQVPNVDEEEIKKCADVVQQKDVFFDQTVYQNYPEGKHSVYAPIGLVMCSYEEGEKIKWELIKGETKEVCGYTCSKARANYSGRTWEVWYAEEIALPFGPWKLVGLPGLVLEAKSKTEDGELLFTAIAFKETNTQITEPLDIKYKQATRKTFVKHKNKFEANPMANIPTAMLKEIQVFKKQDGSKQLLINNVRIRLHKGVPYIPLELE